LKCAAAYFIPLFGMLLIYMIVNKIYAGTFMPVSGQVKRWWGTLPNTVYGRPIKTLPAMIASIFSTSEGSGPFWLITQPLYQFSLWLGKLLSIAEGTQVSGFVVGLVWMIFCAAALAILSRRHRDFLKLSKRFALLPFYPDAFSM
jgi:hypothetical protein